MLCHRHRHHCHCHLGLIGTACVLLMGLLVTGWLAWQAVATAALVRTHRHRPRVLARELFRPYGRPTT